MVTTIDSIQENTEHYKAVKRVKAWHVVFKIIKSGVCKAQGVLLITKKPCNIKL